MSDTVGLPAVTITDVARAARVSPATVSRALNGTGPVSAERAGRVREAAARLGYLPSGPARALRRKVNPVWAAIVADIGNPFFTGVVRGIEDVARTEGHRLVLCNSDEDVDTEMAYIDVVIAERMSGVVVAVASPAESNLRSLVDRGIRVVAVDRRPLTEDIDSVVVDNRLAAETATRHLLENGSSRVACITGPSRVDTANERLQGYLDAHAALGAPVDRALIRRADFKLAGGHAAARSLLESASPPDGLFTANEPMTIGAFQGLRSADAFPEDVALVGFDDAPWTTLTSPQVTVVSQPAYEIGRTAAELLASAEETHRPRHVVCEPTLVVRESSVRQP